MGTETSKAHKMKIEIDPSLSVSAHDWREAIVKARMNGGTLVQKNGKGLTITTSVFGNAHESLQS